MTDYKLSRLYRDAIMGSQVEDVADMQKMIAMLSYDLKNQRDEYIRRLLM